MRNSFQIGKLFGISIRIDYSWFIVFALVAGSLGYSYFPEVYPGWSSVKYWLMGIIAALTFFSSVLAHELAHSLVSKSRGVPVHSITLFIFGGVARLSDEPKSPGSEFWMAVAGPATSIGLGIVFGVLYLATKKTMITFSALAGLLLGVNVFVAAFNLLPGFPLDGGRIFRSIIWKITGNLRKSTRIASVMGRIIAYLLILLGVARGVIFGDWFYGMWTAFIGWFLRNAALSSYRQLALRETLQGVKASEVMISDCQELPGDLTIQELLDSYVPNIHRCFPVMDNGHVIGIIAMQSVREIPREQWKTTRVEQVMIPFAEVKAVHPDDDLYTVMRQMTEENVNQLPVVKDGKFMGMIESGDLIRFINA